jgi:hypothetical protein
MPLIRAGFMSAGVYTPHYALISNFSNYIDVCVGSDSNIYTANPSSFNGFTKFNGVRGTFNSYRNIVTNVTSNSPTYTGIGIDSSLNTYMISNYIFTSPAPTTIKGFLQINNSSGATTATKEILSATANPFTESGRLTVDSSGAILTAYSVYNSNPAYSGYVIKFDNTGAVTWQRSVTVTGNNHMRTKSVATDSSNNVYAVIVQEQFSPQVFSSYIVKWNSSGTIQWQRKITTSNIQLQDVVADSSGNVYVAGYFVSSGSQLGFVAKYDTSGTIQWQRSYVDTNTSGNQNTTFVSIALDSSANVYVTGSLKNTSAGTTMPIVKYNTSGTLQWQRNITDGYTAASQNTSAKSIKISGSNMIIAGQIKGATSGNGSQFLTVLPTDGSKTGTYVISSVGGFGTTVSASATMVYTSSSYTAATATQTDAAGTATEAAGIATVQDITQQTMNNTAGTLTYRPKQIYI